MFWSALSSLGKPTAAGAITGFTASGTALTFDDGPDPVFTPKLLEILTRHRVRATFFVLGRQAELYPEILKDIRKAESEIANHSYSHPSFSLIPPSEQRREIESCAAAIGGAGVKLFRPPHGHTGNGAARTAARLGYRTINWSADSRDWELPAAADILASLRAQARPGAIVLMHDRLETAHDARLFDRTASLEALDRFLDGDGARLSFFPVSELLARSEPVTEDWDAGLTPAALENRRREQDTLLRNAP